MIALQNALEGLSSDLDEVCTVLDSLEQLRAYYLNAARFHEESRNRHWSKVDKLRGCAVETQAIAKAKQRRINQEMQKVHDAQRLVETSFSNLDRINNLIAIAKGLTHVPLS